MTRTSFAASAVVVVFVALLAGCNKPSDESCRKAISNMRTLIGTDSPTSAGADIEGDVRRCKGGSKKKAVDCAAAAKTLDELRACDFMKIPAKAGGDTTGSAGSSAADTTGSAAGSAATGSGDPAGSAAPGSAATGSGAGSGSEMSGSAAAGSAAAGSAAAGAGSAGAGSAAAGAGSAGAGSAAK